jgi:hypothetical protein
LEQGKPWNPDVYVIQRPDQKAYLRVAVPDSASDPISCQKRTHIDQVHTILPGHKNNVCLIAFHLASGIDHPPICFLLWEQLRGTCKVVSFHVERN